MEKPVDAPDWNAHRSSGWAGIDVQHQRLIGNARELCEMYEKGEPVSNIRIALNKLRRHSSFHFQAEEELMQNCQVNGKHQQSHGKSHQSFLEYIDRINALLAADSGVAIGPLLSFLIKWMTLHVSGVDSVMLREIARQRETTELPSSQDVSDRAMLEAIDELYASLAERSFETLELNLQLQEEVARRQLLEKAYSLSQARLRTIADNAYGWEYWQGPDKEIIYMSPSCEQITGYTVEEFTGDPELLNAIIHPEDRHLMEIHMHYVERNKDDGSELDFRIVRKDGEVRWIAHTCKAIYSQNGQYMGRRGSRRDLTDRYRQEESLRLAATVFDSVNEAVLVTSRDNRIIAVNASFTAITGYNADDVIGQDSRMLTDGEPPAEFVRDMWRTLVKTDRWQGEFTNRRKDGQRYIAWVSINSVRDDKGHVTNYISVFSDISERKENEQRIQYLAHHDLLTGLPNRALFSDRLKQTVLTAKRYRANLALMFVDLDKFKPVNDHFGHNVGDLLLKGVAQRLQECVRESDTAARIGGDEFVVLLPGIGNEEDAQTVASKILESLGMPFHVDGNEVQISASIGFAIYPDHGDTDDLILKNADTAMYHAKNGNHTRIVSFSHLAN
ncbi:MAG: diguanylate cyclase [Burkholderiaceae bacterium]|nr:diguanylate cyclase [Burkholderiaceae bacterium]